MTTPSVRKRRLWPWAIVGVLVLAVGVGIGAYLGTRGQADPPDPIATSPSSSSDQVDGCLGGTGRDASTVLSAQSSAPHTTEGAVSYAATFSRWIYQIPLPADIPEVVRENGLDDGVWASYEQSASDWTGPSPVVATTLTGRFEVGEETDDLVTVTLVLPWIVDDAVVPTRRFVPTLTLEWTDDHWEITDASGANAARDDLGTLGTEFEGGC